MFFSTSKFSRLLDAKPSGIKRQAKGVQSTFFYILGETRTYSNTKQNLKMPDQRGELRGKRDYPLLGKLLWQ